MMIPSAESYDFTQIAKDIPGSEGPLVTKDGRIFMVQPSDGLILEIRPDGEKIIIANTGGVPAGLQLDRAGRIWIADMKLGILSLSLDDHSLRSEVSTFDGQPIRGCNDCYFDSEGNLYFTAPAGSGGEKPFGEIFCRLATGEVVRLDNGLCFPNGLAVTSDNSLLIVAETHTRKLWGYRLSAPGQIAEKFLFATLPGTHRIGGDGMDFDSEGRLIATNWGEGSLDIYSREGELLFRVELPFKKCSNVHFTGPDSTTLLITEHEHNGLWRANWPCPGQLQYGWQS